MTFAGKQIGRRNVLKKLAGGFAALLGMSFPFGIARMLHPTAKRHIDDARADKSKRNIQNQSRRNIVRPPGALKQEVNFLSRPVSVAAFVG